MEDKIKNKLIEGLQDNKELKNTINFEGTEEYNINAVTADVARYTKADLILKPSLGEGINLTNDEKNIRNGIFDGNEDRVINYVPSDGGTFTGPVQINVNKTSVDGVGVNEIINRGQMETVISQLDGAPLYTWDVSAGYNAVENDDEVPYKLNTVIGSIEDLPIFEAFASGEAHNKYVTPDSFDNAYIIYGSTYDDAYFNQAYNDVRDTITKLVFKGTLSTEADRVRIRAGEFYADGYQDGSPYGFTNLETVYINPGAYWIDNGVFRGCRKLTTVDIPDSIEKIGKKAFEGCTKLTNIVLGSNIKEIQSEAFIGCTSLKSIAICNNEVTIASNAFSGCTALKKVYFKGTQAEWKTLTSGNSLLNNLEVVTISDTAFPFLYICKTDEKDTSLTSNKMFLKLPNEPLVEISKGAVRLERRDSKTSGNVDYFTYDVLAAVIAGINSRITALGSTALALPEKLTVHDETGNTVVLDIPVNVVSDEADTLIVKEAVVPDVDELQGQLTKVTGRDRCVTPIEETISIAIKEPALDDNGDVLTDEDGNIIYDETKTRYENHTKVVGHDVTYTDPSEYTGDITSVLQAKADEVGRNIQTGYYQKTQNEFTSSSSANTITISSADPTDSTPGQIGDIMIVINTGDGE